jgi:hypothetical protein
MPAKILNGGHIMDQAAFAHGSGQLDRRQFLVTAALAVATGIAAPAARPLYHPSWQKAGAERQLSGRTLEFGRYLPSSTGSPVGFSYK